MNALSNYKMTDIKKGIKVTPHQIELGPDGLKKGTGSAPAERRRVVTAEELKVSGRVFQAFEILRERKIIKLTSFLADIGFNRGNFNTLRRYPEKRALPVFLLVLLVDKYGVDPAWLLTGKGKMFGSKETASEN